jgi:hypothetical protein
MAFKMMIPVFGEQLPNYQTKWTGRLGPTWLSCNQFVRCGSAHGNACSYLELMEFVVNINGIDVTDKNISSPVSTNNRALSGLIATAFTEAGIYIMLLLVVLTVGCWEETERQREATAAWETYIDNIDDSQEHSLSTHSGGSRMQEMFFLFANHFINPLPKNVDLVFLILDGHGSRWLVPALQLLPFLHCQSRINDATKWYWYKQMISLLGHHGASRQSELSGHRHCQDFGQRVVNLSWSRAKWATWAGLQQHSNLIQMHQDETLQLICFSFERGNLNSMNAGGMTTEAQEVQYEIFALDKAPGLSPEESAELWKGLGIDPKNDLGTQQRLWYEARRSSYCGKEELSMGLVSQGSDYENFAKSLSPNITAATKTTRRAIKLINFQLMDIVKVELPAKITKEQ